MGSTDPTPVDWRGLLSADPDTLAAASGEVEIYVRALAAHGVIVEEEAQLSELEDRQATLREKLWPADPLSGYGLHASLGAFLVAKGAVDLVPAGHMNVRSARLQAEGLRHALASHGLPNDVASALVADWTSTEEAFEGSPDGLPISLLAGLAARTLTRSERGAALDQVAASPRDVARLAAATELLGTVRAVLPLLPIPSLGPAYDLAVVGLSIGRADRVAALLHAPTDVFMAALYDLAAASAALGRGAPYPYETDIQVASPIPLASDLLDTGDVVSIEEDGADRGGRIQACQWREGAVSNEDLAAWTAELGRWRSTQGTLGLRVPAAPPTVVSTPIPPDAGLVRRSLHPGQLEDATERIELIAPRFAWRNDPLDAMAPVVRAAVRIVAAAAEGKTPVPGALERAGDMVWLVRRAMALAAVVQGDPRRALEATDALPPGASPERRWAQDRLRRYGERTAHPADPEEARPLGAALIGDLAHQLARTVTGMVPQERR